MRKMFLVAAASLALSGCAGMSMEPVPEGEREVSTIYHAPGMSQEEIYDEARIWVAENFRSADAVLEHEDPDDGVIIGNGMVSYPCEAMGCMVKDDWDVRFTMRVDVKPERFKVDFKNILLTWPPSGGMPGHEGPVSLKQDMDKIRLALVEMSDEMHEHIVRGPASDDW